MTDITNNVESSEDSTKSHKRGRKEGTGMGARAASMTLAAVIDGKLVFEVFKSKLFDGLLSEDGKKITNASIIQEAVDWFKTNHGIVPQHMTEPYYTRFSLGSKSASSTSEVCPYEVANIDLKHGTAKLGIYEKQWKVSYREIEQDENWVFIAKAISRETSDEKSIPKPAMKLVHISKIAELTAAAE